MGVRSILSCLVSTVIASSIATAQNTYPWPSSGNVGIGTTSPAQPLTVRVNTNQDFYFQSRGGTTTDLSIANDAATVFEPLSMNGSTIILNATSLGDVGIGTASPGANLEVVSPSTVAGRGIVSSQYSSDAAGALLSLDKYRGALASPQVVLNNDYVGEISLKSFDGRSLLDTAGFGARVNGAIAAGSVPTDLYFYTTAGANSTDPYANNQIRMVISSSGNVGIGTTSPGAKMELTGSLKLTSGSGGSITFQDGTVQSTAYTGVTCGGDYADSVDVAGERKQYEPGDVLVLTEDGKGDVTKSFAPYSTLVAGIYSTRPGTVGRRQLTDRSTATQEIPMAMVGIVPTKVSAENGPIRRGDLLVTASMKGYAMKGTDRSRMLGAVVGKAMGSLDSGEGVIEVLVTLQ